MKTLKLNLEVISENDISEDEFTDKLIEFFEANNCQMIGSIKDVYESEIEDSNYLEKVKEFMLQFNQTVEENPVIPTKEICDFRIRLLQEELNELQKAIDDNNFVEIFDALLDLQYVLTGAIHTFGLGNKFKEGFEEVQKSNMSKSCKNEDELYKTLDFYNEQGIDVYFHKNEKTQRYNVHRKSDGKVLKNINYKKVDLLPILTKK